METLLRRAHYLAKGVLTGRDALALLGSFDPLVVLVDLALPDMSGLDVLRAGRQTEKHRAFVLIARFGHEDDRAEAIRLGAFDCIEQPLSPELILTVVHNAATGQARTDEPHESHALARWADVVVRAIGAPRDLPTLQDWSRVVAVSKGGIRNWCYTARLSPRLSLQFTRVLRAVARHAGFHAAPEDLLDIVDRRTLAKVMRSAGGTATSLPRSVEQFLEHQRIIDNTKAIRVVRAALQLDRRAGPDAHPERYVQTGASTMRHAQTTTDARLVRGDVPKNSRSAI
jgi:DNA-binding response OmpR family regulator